MICERFGARCGQATGVQRHGGAGLGCASPWGKFAGNQGGGERLALGRRIRWTGLEGRFLAWKSWAASRPPIAVPS